MSNQPKPVKSEGIVLWHTSMSLDGFIAGPDDSMDWIFNYSYPKNEIDEVIRTTGALLVGRRSYDVGRAKNAPTQTQKPYEGQWKGPQFVLTHHPPDTSDDPTITFLKGDISEAVNRALEAAAGKNVVVIGASIARQCIDAGLIDEMFIHIVPILLGDGVPLFRREGYTKTELEMISFTQSDQITNLRFRVIKSAET
ncbi:MAG: dihydrofolate reductase family protein [Promethearchaeota archaeon]